MRISLIYFMRVDLEIGERKFLRQRKKLNFHPVERRKKSYLDSDWAWPDFFALASGKNGINSVYRKSALLSKWSSRIIDQTDRYNTSYIYFSHQRISFRNPSVSTGQAPLSYLSSSRFLDCSAESATAISNIVKSDPSMHTDPPFYPPPAQYFAKRISRCKFN